MQHSVTQHVRKCPLYVSNPKLFFSSVRHSEMTVFLLQHEDACPSCVFLDCSQVLFVFSLSVVYMPLILSWHILFQYHTASRESIQLENGVCIQVCVFKFMQESTPCKHVAAEQFLSR